VLIVGNADKNETRDQATDVLYSSSEECFLKGAPPFLERYSSCFLYFSPHLDCGKPLMILTASKHLSQFLNLIMLIIKLSQEMKSKPMLVRTVPKWLVERESMLITGKK